MEFKDVAIGEIFYDHDSGEFYKRFDYKTAAIYDFMTCGLYVQNGCTIEKNFPPDHVVETIWV
jgi:hypothetical protein